MELDVLAALEAWYDAQRPSPQLPAERYVVCAGLAVLEHMRAGVPIERAAYVTERNQVRTGGPFIKGILARYGERRPYASEGGRTTRATVPAADALARLLNGHEGLAGSDESTRIRAIDTLQRWLVDRVVDYFAQQRISLDVHIDAPGGQFVGRILEAAGNKAGAVAQHLVGAKLDLRFRSLEIPIENHSSTTADLQLGRSGDFTVGDTVFHVTMAPSTAVIEKCRSNLRNGLMPTLLVPDGVLAAARQLALVAGLADQIDIYASIESFVGQNIGEMGRFERSRRIATFRDLLATYNNRVAAVEPDRSLLIEIPLHLQ